MGRSGACSGGGPQPVADHSAVLREPVGRQSSHACTPALRLSRDSSGKCEMSYGFTPIAAPPRGRGGGGGCRGWCHSHKLRVNRRTLFSRPARPRAPPPWSWWKSGRPGRPEITPCSSDSGRPLGPRQRRGGGVPAASVSPSTGDNPTGRGNCRGTGEAMGRTRKAPKVAGLNRLWLRVILGKMEASMLTA